LRRTSGNVKALTGRSTRSGRDGRGKRDRHAVAFRGAGLRVDLAEDGQAAVLLVAQKHYDHIAKPFNPEVLFHSILRWLEKSRA